MEKKNIGSVFALYPTPATVIGTVNEDGKPNWMLLAHVGIISHSKLSISIHKSHLSCNLINGSKTFSVNMIDESFLKQADYTGVVSGKNADKSAVFEYHLGDNGSPVIEVSPLTMECEVVDTYEVDDFINFIATIKNTYIDSDKLDEKGKIDYYKLKPVLFEMPTYHYLATGDVIGDCVKIGQAYKKELAE